ncbi:MAG: hypothetical protein ABIP45_06840 [Knoellia sp.]
MRLRSMSTERLLGASARLLAAASVLTAAGLALNMWFGWEQTGQSYGEDGTATDVGLPFGQRVFLLLAFDLSYRQIGIQLLLASALVAAAVVVLHRNPSLSPLRSLRWEVLASGCVVFAPVVGLVVANLYFLIFPPDAGGDLANYIGPMPWTEMAIANLTTLGASLLTLTFSTLWWLRLGTEDDPVSTDDESDGHDDRDESTDAEEKVEQEAADDSWAPTHLPLDRSAGVDSLEGGAGENYQHDWSPEDFRPPR